MLARFRTRIRKYSIKSRMFFAFIVLPQGVMVLMFLLYYFISLDIVTSKNQENASAMVSLTEENVHLNTMRMEDQLENINQRAFTKQLFDHPENGQYRKTFEKYLKTNVYLEGRKGIQLFNKEKKLIYNENKQPVFQLDKLLKTNTRGDITFWAYDAQDHEVALVSSVYQNNIFLGYAVCGFSETSFSSSFTHKDSKNDFVVIVDEDDRYLFGSNMLRYGTKIATKKDTMEIHQQTYYSKAKPITDMTWKVVNLVSSDYVLEEFHNFRNVVLLYGILIVIILEIIATIVYRSIYDPLHNMLKTMNSFNENTIMENRVEDTGNDEIHEVAKNFNELLDRVKELVDTVEMEEEQKRETQFLLLQAQINPHFLFNTLNTLHFLAIMNEDNPVSEGIGALAKLLRNTISDCKEQVSIREEVENLKNYIIIQKLRYGDLFETVYNVDEDVWDCRILKLLLQPIVENSILHAFVEDKEHQQLLIRIQKQGTYLKISIGDNGKGFVKENQPKISKNLSGIGIENIQERISLMYGEEYSMVIESVIGVGTITTLLLPYSKGVV